MHGDGTDEVTARRQADAEVSMGTQPEEIVLRVVVDTAEARAEIERMVSTLLDADHLEAIEAGALRLSDVLGGAGKLLEVLAERANRAAKELRGRGEG